MFLRSLDWAWSGMFSGGIFAPLFYFVTFILLCVAAWVITAVFASIMKDLSVAAGNIVIFVFDFFGFGVNLPKALVDSTQKIRNLMDTNKTSYDAVVSIIGQELKVAATKGTGLDLVDRGREAIDDLMSDNVT